MLEAPQSGGAGADLALGAVAGMLAAAGLLSIWRPAAQLILTGIAAHVAAWILLSRLATVTGEPSPGFWALVVAAWLTAWAFAQALSNVGRKDRTTERFLGVAVPLVFGLWLLILWELLVRGFDVPRVLLPPPSAIWDRLVSSVPTLLPTSARPS
jgi:NitT/TauT family transport system permease protein